MGGGVTGGRLVFHSTGCEPIRAMSVPRQAHLTGQQYLIRQAGLIIELGGGRRILSACIAPSETRWSIVEIRRTRSVLGKDRIAETESYPNRGLRLKTRMRVCHQGAKNTGLHQDIFVNPGSLGLFVAK